MRKPLDEIQVGVFNEESTITVTIYEEFVTATVSLSLDDSFDAMVKGGVSAERQALTRLLRSIFNEEKENLKVFNSEIQFGLWKDTQRFQVPDLSNGGFSKTAIFLLDTKSFEKSLEETISYIKKKHNHFLNPRAEQENIAKNILGKHFRK
jgi:hypothetical protein